MDKNSQVSSVKLKNKREIDNGYSYLLLNSENVEIGTLECRIYHKELHSVVKIYDEYQKKGYGFVSYKKMLEDLGQENIECIVGSWHKHEEFSWCEDGMSTNLKLFLECYKTMENPELCAFKTPTGKWSRRLGYDYCKVGAISDESVTVKFYRKTD